VLSTPGRAFAKDGRPNIWTNVSSQPPFYTNLTIDGNSTKDLSVRIRNPDGNPAKLRLSYNFAGLPEVCQPSVQIGCMVYNQTATMATMARWSRWLQASFNNSDDAWISLTNHTTQVPWSAWPVLWHRWGVRPDLWMSSFRFVDRLDIQDYHISKKEFALAYDFSNVYPSILSFARTVGVYPNLDSAWKALTGNSEMMPAVATINIHRFTRVWDALQLSDRKLGLVSAGDVFKYLSRLNHSVLDEGEFTLLYESATVDKNTRLVDFVAAALPVPVRQVRQGGGSIFNATYILEADHAASVWDLAKPLLLFLGTSVVLLLLGSFAHKFFRQDAVKDQSRDVKLNKEAKKTNVDDSDIIVISREESEPCADAAQRSSITPLLASTEPTTRASTEPTTHKTAEITRDLSKDFRWTRRMFGEVGPPVAPPESHELESVQLDLDRQRAERLSVIVNVVDNPDMSSLDDLDDDQDVERGAKPKCSCCRSPRRTMESISQ
jgi:hypothetical protein